MGMGMELQVVSMIAVLASSQQQRKAFELEAQSYKEQADLAKIQAGQQEAERNRKLRIQLAALGTAMSSQGVALGTSPSVSALEKDEIQIAKNDIASIRLMGMSSRRKFELSAAGSQAGASATRMGGFAKAAGGVYSTFYKPTGTA